MNDDKTRILLCVDMEKSEIATLKRSIVSGLVDSLVLSHPQLS